MNSNICEVEVDVEDVEDDGERWNICRKCKSRDSVDIIKAYNTVYEKKQDKYAGFNTANAN